MPDAEMLKWMTTLGPGLALALLVIFWARIDRKNADDRYTADRKTSEDRYAADRKASEERFAALARDWREVIENNTKALTTIEMMVQRGLAECPFVKNIGKAHYSD